MSKIIKILVSGIKYLTYEWLIVLINLIKKFCKIFKKKSQDKKEKPRRERLEAKDNCIPIKSPVYYKPDPMIYSQHYLMKLGLAVTWDNPDIQLYKNGTAVSSHSLLPDTDYDIVARIYNASYEAPVVGMPVRFSFLDFGAGTISKNIGQTMINLGIIGGSDNPNIAKVKWRTPAAAGHYCIQVKLDWADDKNPENNLGQENTNVALAQSPAHFTFKVNNSDKKAHKYHIEVDTYTLPEQQECQDLIKRKEDSNEEIRARHNRANHPIPNGWTVEFEPSVFGLAANEEIEIKGKITPPDSFVGIKPFNINVFNDLNLMVGGVTISVQKN